MRLSIRRLWQRPNQSLVERKLEESICDAVDFVTARRRLRLLRQTDAHTLVDRKRRRRILELLREVDVCGIDGDYVEAGVYRGGVSALLLHEARDSTRPRRVWLYDSFQGLPEPTLEDGLVAAEWAHGRAQGHLRPIGKLQAPQAHVETLLVRQFGFPPEMISFVAKWLQDVDVTEVPRQIAFLHIDLDWYESVKAAFRIFGPSLVPHAWIVIDDYGFWPGARLATDEFVRRHYPSVTIARNGFTQAFFQVPDFARP